MNLKQCIKYHHNPNNPGKCEEFTFFILGPKHKIIFAYRETKQLIAGRMHSYVTRIRWNEGNRIPAVL